MVTKAAQYWFLAAEAAGRYCSCVSFDALLKEVDALDATAQRKLIAYMAAIEDRRQADYPERLAKKIDDRTPGKWLTVEECERELGLRD